MTTAEDPGFYDRAFRRIDWIGLVLTLAGGAFCLIWRGGPWGSGFLIGAALSLLNFRLWKRLANSIGTSGKRPFTGSAVILGLRYVLLAAIIFVIIKYFGVSLPALLAGLLVAVAAVLTEAVFELFFEPRT